jgi:hypothetical protein
MKLGLILTLSYFYFQIETNKILHRLILTQVFPQNCWFFVVFSPPHCFFYFLQRILCITFVIKLPFAAFTIIAMTSMELNDFTFQLETF